MILYAFLRHYRPRRVIEIGSGFSSALMLDVNDSFLQKTIQFTFIEPNPQRLFDLLDPRDREMHTIIPDIVQKAPIELFRNLRAGDILFIDSSHILKIGSDVAYLIFDVLPSLAKGVIIHFHDIIWPFEYPQAWYSQGLDCNEAHFLRAFLQYNPVSRILFFNTYLSTFHTDVLAKNIPLFLSDPGSSLWLEKV
jgi:hypothetical protein